MVTTKNTLDKELKFYKEHKKEYLASYKGQFVLIKKSEFGGAFTTEKEAYEAGILKYGNNPFLIKQVLEDEDSVSFPALHVGVINASL